MEKTSAQQSYLNFLRAKMASSCEGAHSRPIPAKKTKKATIVKAAYSGYESALQNADPASRAALLQHLGGGGGGGGQSMLIDPDTQRRLHEHNVKSMRTAGGVLGGGAGLLGGGALGAGLGALIAGKGKRLPGAGWGALAGGGAGGVLGGLLGPGMAEGAADQVTAKDLQALNAMAQQQLAQAGYGPYAGDIQASATFGKNTGDEKPFNIEDYYWRQ